MRGAGSLRLDIKNLCVVNAGLHCRINELEILLGKAVRGDGKCMFRPGGADACGQCWKCAGYKLLPKEQQGG